MATSMNAILCVRAADIYNLSVLVLLQNFYFYPIAGFYSILYVSNCDVLFHYLWVDGHSVLII